MKYIKTYRSHKVPNLIYKNNKTSVWTRSGFTLINVLIWVLLGSLLFLLLFLPKFGHGQELEIWLVGSIFRKDVIIVFFPACIRLQEKGKQLKDKQTWLKYIYFSYLKVENINWKNQNSKSTYLHFTQQHQSLIQKEQGPGLEYWEQMSSCWIGGVASAAQWELKTW